MLKTYHAVISTKRLTFLFFLKTIEVSNVRERGPGKAKGKKSTPASQSAANKEKQKEKDKRKEERQQQRNVLAEQNSLLLSRMADMADQGDKVQNESTCIPDSLLQDCMDIIQLPQRICTINTTPVHASFQPTQPRPPSTSNITPLQSNITLLSSVRQSPSNINVTPLQPRGQRPPSNPFARLPSQEQARPQFGGKRPRRRPLDVAERLDSESIECSSCKRLKEEVQSLRSQLAAYEAQNGMFLI